MGKYIEFLRETDLFYNLTTTQMEMIESFCEERVCQDGETIFMENTRDNEMYMVLRGEVKILINPGLVASRPGLNLRPEVIASMSRGQSFGEIALVDEGVRTASARASGKDVRLLKIPRDRLLLLCNTYPELGFRIMHNLAVDLASKLRNTDLKLREASLFP